jgi:hypothetical protein
MTLSTLAPRLSDPKIVRISSVPWNRRKSHKFSAVAHDVRSRRSGNRAGDTRTKAQKPGRRGDRVISRCAIKARGLAGRRRGRYLTNGDASRGATLYASHDAIRANRGHANRGGQPRNRGDTAGKPTARVRRQAMRWLTARYRSSGSPPPFRPHRQASRAPVRQPT